MSTNFTRKITAAVVGAAATAGIFTGITLAAPAQANAGPSAAMTCAAVMAPRPSATGNLNPLTRAAQVSAISASSTARAAGTTCLGR